MSGRIPQHFIDDLLSRIDIVDVVDSRIKLKKTGRNYSACCPFHKEKTPSFTVSPDKQFYYCFGCGASGNAVGFVIDHDHLDFPTAVDSLAGQLGLEVPHEQTHKRRGPDNSELYELMDKAVKLYTQQLRQHKQSPKAINYLKQRGLDGTTCDAFGIGFAPPGWDNLQKELATSPEKEKKLITAGILVHNEDSDRIYDRFRDRIMFPIRDSRGRYIAFGGRVLGDEKPKYLNSPESPIFHKGKELYGLYEARQANRNLSRIIVVEGYMDVVALTQQGISNSVATLGTATTIDHMQRLFKVVSEVVFCFDGDDAGRRAAWRALESTLPNMEDGRQARFMFLPQGEDPDSMVRQAGSEQFLALIKDQALSLDNFLFKQLEDGLDLNTMDGRARLAKLAGPYLQKLPEGLFHQLLIKKLSDITGLDSQYLSTHFEEEAADIAKSEPKTPQLLAPASVPAQQHQYDDIPAYNYHPEADYSDYQPHHQDEQSYSQPSSKSQGSYKPKQSASSPSRMKTRLSTSGYAIRQLLCNPEFAIDVQKPFDKLTLKSDTDNALLLDLLKTLKEQPTLNTGTLIAQWYGTDNGKRLEALAALELTTEPNITEFQETLDEIRFRAEQNSQQTDLQSLLSTLQNKSPSQMNEEERRLFTQSMALLSSQTKTDN
ncbi:DNA primase [Endozoicomonas sp. (ex Bugula neritina AB1)]|nr:DNA primase [Endozoicomonas sp. (ex Bugula neritina AB1)]